MKGFPLKVVTKLIENVLSIKVWIIFSYMLASGFLVITGKMTGGEFSASNGSIISIVLAIREGVKVRKLTIAGNGSTPEQLKEIEKITV